MQVQRFQDLAMPSIILCCFQTVSDMVKQCFLYNGSTVVQQPINVAELSGKIRDDAKTFIQANQGNSFFLYLAFPQVHNTNFCNDEFCGKSTRGNDVGIVGL